VTVEPTRRAAPGNVIEGWSHAAEKMTKEIDWTKVAVDYRNTDVPLGSCRGAMGEPQWDPASRQTRSVEFTESCW
jgi:hypothetical protein